MFFIIFMLIYKSISDYILFTALVEIGFEFN